MHVAMKFPASLVDSAHTHGRTYGGGCSPTSNRSCSSNCQAFHQSHTPSKQWARPKARKAGVPTSMDRKSVNFRRGVRIWNSFPLTWNCRLPCPFGMLVAQPSCPQITDCWLGKRFWVLPVALSLAFLCKKHIASYMVTYTTDLESVKRNSKCFFPFLAAPFSSPRGPSMEPNRFKLVSCYRSHPLAWRKLWSAAQSTRSLFRPPSPRAPVPPAGRTISSAR